MVLFWEKITEYFLLRRFAIVDPDIPEPIIQNSLIYQQQPFPLLTWLVS